MGLNSEGYRTGGVTSVRTSLITPLTAASLEDVAAAQILIEEGGKLPLFKVRWDTTVRAPDKGRGSYVLGSDIPLFVAALKLGYTMVTCQVEGEEDEELKRFTTVEVPGNASE